MPKTKEAGARGRGPGARVRTHRMEGLEQVRALSHPLRLRLLELFAQRPRTTKQAAEEMGEAPTRLYHHVAALERAGLVRLRETRRIRGATEKYFEAVAHRFEVSEPAVAELGQKRARRDRAAMGFVVFDQARNELVRVLASDDVPEAMLAIRGVLLLSPARAKRLEKQLLELLEGLRSRPRRESGRGSRAKLRRYSLTLALLPADPGGNES
jgi:DNA-binding transcriptional ArsR family regulator